MVSDITSLRPKGRQPRGVVTLYHNPDCSTSRRALALIEASGEVPVVIEYLKTPPSSSRLKSLAREMGIPVRGLLRKKETVYAEHDLDDPKWSDDDLLGFVVQYPRLLERPIVETPNGARICRPAELVLDLLTYMNP
ncbi:arsenate reductase [Afipia carboxidovorans OM5]|nr:arsenate reductase (glutaredoxin) [Afipia carboxidovorans]ACI93816.1 arsenate reductase [Afipia carboxidovorans OM5]